VRNLLFQVACCTAGLAFLAAPLSAQSGQATLRGMVRDRGGIPQIGASIELLRADSSVAAMAHTDGHGIFTLEHLIPGVYALRATEEAFLPSLREGLRLAANQQTVANLTMSTLFEAVEWLPAERRSATEPQDDWKWTLRATANRPLLRFTDDGPVVVSDEGTAQQGSAIRIRSGAGGRAFGQGGWRSGFAYERDSADGGRVLLLNDGGAAGPGMPAISSVLAAERPLGPHGAVRTAVAYTQMPQVSTAGQTGGLEAVSLRTAETTELSPALVAEFGAEMQAMRGMAPQSFPFASLSWRGAENAVSLTVATAQDAQHAEQLADEDTEIPPVTERGGQLVVEHGLHRELRWNHSWSAGAQATAAVYDDRIDNPVLNGGGAVSFADAGAGMLLLDPIAGALRATGPEYGGPGFLLEGDAPLASWMALSLSLADGAVVMAPAALPRGSDLQQILSGAHGESAQAVSLAAYGKSLRAGTRWRASYRWQPSDALTPVDPFDIGMGDAYLSLFLRQPIHMGRVLPGGMEALFDIRNLLAQGYRPFLTADGSTLFFAQVDRSVQGGIAFTF
jgi:hypothetical protein